MKPIAGKVPNYLVKIQRMIASGAIPPGAVTDVVVAHDSWCAIYRAAPCNCDPEIIGVSPCPAAARGN